MLSKIRTDQPLIEDRDKIAKTIANYWDKTSEAWHHVWGPHIHHGYYDDSGSSITPQERLIEKLLEFLHITEQSKILDVGCGMGGSSLYIAQHYHASVIGISLSHKQIKLAREAAKKNNIANVNFEIEDAHSLKSFPHHTFDIIWSLESCEQFYDKPLFIKEAYRVLKPGGKLLLATWCSDREEYDGMLADKYKKLCLAFDLPYLPTINFYSKLLEHTNFELLKNVDWTNHVIKSWDIGISLVSSYSLLKIIKLAGLRGLRFARQLKLMQEAFHQGRVRYGVFLGSK